eukprot:PhM_4_TR18873/c2_g1_i6/m.82953
MHSDSTSDSNNNTNPDNNKPITEYKLFDSGVTTHYRLPSAAVHPTQGLEQYARHERTPHWLKKQRAEETGDKHPAVFTLCNAYQQGRCGRGTACRYVHADLAHPDAVATPVHSVKCATPYCLPAGTAVPVVDRATGTSATHRSERVLVTKGSDDWHTTTPAARRRIFHCKHFHEEGMCLRGSDCVFLHVLPPVSPVIAGTTSSGGCTFEDKGVSTSRPCEGTPRSFLQQHSYHHRRSPLTPGCGSATSRETSPLTVYMSVPSIVYPTDVIAAARESSSFSSVSSAATSIMNHPAGVGARTTATMSPTTPTATTTATYSHDPYSARVLMDSGYLFSTPR